MVMKSNATVYSRSCADPSDAAIAIERRQKYTTFSVTRSKIRVTQDQVQYHPCKFEDIGHHGTKLIVYDLWLDDEGKMELDFDSDPEDIRIGLNGKVNAKEGSLKAISENHIAKRIWFSLRAYLSVLYRKLPAKFAIYLRRKAIVYHNIAAELRFQEYILYRAHKNEGSVITTIGFFEEAPDVSIHGFNIYHKNRLILVSERVLAVVLFNFGLDASSYHL